MSKLAALAAYAQAARTGGANRTPVYELTVEAARSRVVIKDSNKQKAEDGSQALSLYLNGKGLMSLDAIQPGASRIVAKADQVQEFTQILEEGVNNGDFDKAIEEAQAKAKAAAEKSAAAKAANAAKGLEGLNEPTGESGVPEVDLSALDQVG
jgi:hypothetical protein